MAAYYNEIDPGAAAWLRELIKAGQIAAGDVDERSIEDVQPDDLRDYTQCHFFAGIGGWSLALRRAGWDDARPVWTGSAPCQPFSAAGKGLGESDERHLWPVFLRLIAECRPSVIFGEQVASSAVIGRANKAVQAMRGGAALVGLQGAQQRRLEGYLQAVREHSGQGSKAMGVGCQASLLEGTAGDSSRILFDERCQETSEGKGSRVRSGLEGHPGAHRSRGLRGDGDSVRSVDAEGMERPIAGSARSEGRVHAGEHQGGLVRAEHNGQLLGRRSDLAHRGCDQEETLIERVERLLQEDRGQFAAEPDRTWIDVVRDDLDRAGYAIGVCVLPACSVGSPHIRQRLYWVAHADGERLEGGNTGAMGHQRQAAERGRGSSGLADGHQHGRAAFPVHRFRNYERDAEPCGSSGWMGDADRNRAWRDRGAVHSQIKAVDGKQRADDAGAPSGDLQPGPLHGHWRDADWLLCQDGKWRPVEPGTFPLVDGLPRGLVRGGDKRLAPNSSAEGRVMRLRGYGNAIVPQVASAFISAAMG